MINLKPDEEQTEVATLARSLGAELLYPAARDAERDGAVPPDVWQKLFETGLTVPVPEEHGGGGIPEPLSLLAAAENLAHGDPGIALAAMWNGNAALVIARHGTPEQQLVLSRLASDPSARCAVAAYEGFGRGPTTYATTITVEGNQVRVIGHKAGVAFAAVADPLIVIGVDGETGAQRAVVLTAGTPGVMVADSPGHIALDAAQMSSIDLDVTVPVTALLGGPDADSLALRGTIQQLRLLTAAAAVGTAQRATEYAAQYASTRVAFGRPIAAFQGVAFPLAESLIRIEAARLELSAVTLMLLAEPSADHEVAVAQAVTYAMTVGTQSTRDALQTLGGHGFIKDHPVELWYRSAAALSALDLDTARAPFAAAL
jgi:alkylation response protein AidB-like acyl-CoA dehydrogenase